MQLEVKSLRSRQVLSLIAFLSQPRQKKEEEEEKQKSVRSSAINERKLTDAATGVFCKLVQQSTQQLSKQEISSFVVV